MRRLIPDPFILALLATLALATLLPARGQAAVLVDWLSTATIVLLFFFHGAKLSREAVIDGLKSWRIHLAILGSTFVMFPLLGLALAGAFPGLMPPPLWVGILYLCALPSTVQSSIAFTSIARGNVPAAIAAASASQLLGVLLTPFLVGLLAGAHGGHVPVSGVGRIMLQILVPFVIGHLLRPWIGGWVARHKAAISLTDRSTILIAVYSAFSGAVIEGIWSRLPLPALAILCGICAAVLAIALLFTAHARPDARLRARGRDRDRLLRDEEVADPGRADGARAVRRAGSGIDPAADHGVPPAAADGLRVDRQALCRGSVRTPVHLNQRGGNSWRKPQA